MPIRAMVTLPYNEPNEGFPGTVNTYHFEALETAGPSDVAFAAAVALLSLYEYLGTSNVFSELLSGDCNFKFYDLDDPIPRTVLYEENNTITVGSGSTAPPELAICASFRAQMVSGEPKARRRGRVFIGPLKTGAIDTSTGKISSSYQTNVRDAFAAFYNDISTGGDANWVIYSKADNDFYHVTGGWVDDDFDWQSRRSFPLGVQRLGFQAGHG